MESNTNYTAVGAFVLGLTLLFALTLWWLISSGHPGNAQSYLIYADDSVAGLKVSSDVLYHGVKVGQVGDIDIDPSDPARVRIRVEIERCLQLRNDTVAELSPLGVTGQAVINLQGGHTAQALSAAPGQSLAVIPYGSSLMSRVEGNLSHTTAQLDTTLNQLNALLSPRNVGALGQTLQHTEHVAAELDRHRQDIGQSLVALRQGSQQLVALSASDGRLARTLDQVDSAASSWRAAGDGGARSLDQLRVLIEQLSTLLHDLRRDPSQLLYGAPAAAPGPGEQP